MSGEVLLERSERGSRPRRFLDEWMDRVDDASDAAANLATMARRAIQKEIPGSGPGVARTGRPDVPVIVEDHQPHDGIGAYDVTSNMVILVTVFIKGGELTVHRIASKLKGSSSGKR